MLSEPEISTHFRRKLSLVHNQFQKIKITKTFQPFFSLFAFLFQNPKLVLFICIEFYVDHKDKTCICGFIGIPRQTNSDKINISIQSITNLKVRVLNLVIFHKYLNKPRSGAEYDNNSLLFATFRLSKYNPSAGSNKRYDPFPLLLLCPHYSSNIFAYSPFAFKQLKNADSTLRWFHCDVYMGIS